MTHERVGSLPVDKDSASFLKKFNSSPLPNQLKIATRLLDDPLESSYDYFADSDHEQKEESDEESDGIDMLSQPLSDREESRKKIKATRYDASDYATGKELDEEFEDSEEDLGRRRKKLTLDCDQPMTVTKGALLKIENENILVCEIYDTGFNCKKLLDNPLFKNTNRFHPHQIESLSASNELSFFKIDQESVVKNLAPNQWLVSVAVENGENVEANNMLADLVALCGEQDMDVCVKDNIVWFSSPYDDIGGVIDVLLMQGDLEALVAKRNSGFAFVKSSRKKHFHKCETVQHKKPTGSCHNCGSSCKSRVLFEKHLAKETECATALQEEIEDYKAENMEVVEKARLDLARSIFVALGKAKGKYRAACGLPMEKKEYLALFGYNGFDPTNDDFRRDITSWQHFRLIVGTSSLLWNRKRNRTKKIAVSPKHTCIVNLKKIIHATGSFHFLNVSFGIDCT